MPPSHNSPNNNSSNFGVDSYETSFNMDGTLYPLTSALNQHSSNSGYQPESANVNIESIQETTPDNFQPLSVSLYQCPSSTPVKHRIASYQHFLPLGSPNIPAQEMANYLAIKLDKIVPIPILNLPSIIFPDSLLPFPINEALVTSLGNKIWSSHKKILKPPKMLTEIAVQEWLNNIVQAVSKATGFILKKTWSSQFTNTVLSGSELNHKPNIILISTRLLNPINWRNIHAVTEVTSSPIWHSTMKKTINNKTYLMFCTQHSHQFVPFLSIFALILSTSSSLTAKGRQW